MTREETGKILAVLRVSYPSFGTKVDDIQILLDIWDKCLKEYDYPVVSKAISQIIKTRVEGYPPTIGEVNKLIERLVGKNEDTAVELWNSVIKAVKNGYYGYESEFAKLPLPCQKWLGGASALRDYSLIDLNTLNTVTKSNFLKTIGDIKEREVLKEVGLSLSVNVEKQTQIQKNVQKLIDLL